MVGISKRLNFLFTVAIGIVYAGCGGPQQVGQSASPQQVTQRAFPQLQAHAVTTPLPGSAVSHRASRQLPRYATSSQPLLYVGNSSGSTVEIFPFTGPNQQQIGTIPNVAPWGLSLDANNALYVANGGRGTVTVYPYGSTSASMTYTGVHRALYALADSAGHVFVSGQTRRSRGHVLEFNAGTNVVFRSRKLGSETDGMAVDGQGNLYVAYRAGGKFPTTSIAEFGPKLRTRRLLGMTIDQPQGLLVDSAGNVVVVESEADRIDVFPPGATTPSVTVTISGIGNLAELAMQNSETTLLVSSEGGFVYSMPYPLTPSTVPTEYEENAGESNGLAVSNPP